MNSEYAINLKSMFYDAFEEANKKSYKYTWKDISEIQMHGYRVSEISGKIAMKMGLSKMDIEAVRICGNFHDIGKFQIDPYILNKRDSLTTDEFAIIKNHAIYSQEIMLRKGKFEYSSIVLFHHERMDGSGYYGLKNDEIPLISKIIAVADIYDALNNDRAYRRAYKRETALKIIEQEKHKYDADVYKAFTFCV